jgi:hypothetical protein
MPEVQKQECGAEARELLRRHFQKELASGFLKTPGGTDILA